MDDLAVKIRDEAVRVLIDFDTLAGDAVEAERVDEIEPGDMPRIIVFGDAVGETASQGGTAPSFDTTLTLAIDCFVERAKLEDVRQDLDLLAWQVKEGLLGDAGWVKLSANIASLKVNKKFSGKGELITGEARVLLTCTWRETYPPRIRTPLKTITASPLPTTPPGATPVSPPSLDQPLFVVDLPVDRKET